MACCAIRDGILRNSGWHVGNLGWHVVQFGMACCAIRDGMLCNLGWHVGIARCKRQLKAQIRSAFWEQMLEAQFEMACRKRRLKANVESRVRTCTICVHAARTGWKCMLEAHVKILHIKRVYGNCARYLKPNFLTLMSIMISITNDNQKFDQ
jgi:hypothetical protein